MDKKHLPYNVLLVIAVAAIGLMAICTFGIRNSSFAVTVVYALPQPEIISPEPAPSQETGQPPQSRADIVSPQASGAVEPSTAYGESEHTITAVQFPLDLNKATYEQLLFIPGVGDVTAQRITQYRDYLGGAYTRMDQLMEIKGIGEGTYRKITAYLYLEAGEQPQEAGEEEAEESETIEEDDMTDLEGPK